MNDLKLTLEKGLVIWVTGTVEYSIMGELLYHIETLEMLEGTPLKLVEYASAEGGLPEIERLAAEAYEKMYG